MPSFPRPVSVMYIFFSSGEKHSPFGSSKSSATTVILHQAIAFVPGTPAPLDISAKMISRATQPNMLARVQAGQSIDQVIAWAQDELEGFAR
jgi:hypothetical protein